MLIVRLIVKLLVIEILKIKKKFFFLKFIEIFLLSLFTIHFFY